MQNAAISKLLYFAPVRLHLEGVSLIWNLSEKELPGKFRELCILNYYWDVWGLVVLG